MKDKEIIFNEVKVNECSDLGSQYNCTVKANMPCKIFPNCYFKQLQRKEQECEKEKQNAKDTYKMWQALIKSFNISQKENSNLRQALDDIISVWENDKDGDYDFIKWKILDIINKAKDGE